MCPRRPPVACLAGCERAADAESGHSTAAVSGERQPKMAADSGVKGIFDYQALDALAVVQVFAVEAGAARVERGGDDEGIVEAELVARLDIEGTVVERRAGRD